MCERSERAVPSLESPATEFISEVVGILSDRSQFLRLMLWFRCRAHLSRNGASTAGSKSYQKSLTYVVHCSSSSYTTDIEDRACYNMLPLLFAKIQVVGWQYAACICLRHPQFPQLHQMSTDAGQRRPGISTLFTRYHAQGLQVRGGLKAGQKQL